MSQIDTQEIIVTGGAELTVAAMDNYSRENLGRNTYLMVRRLMRNPEYKAMIQELAAKLDAQDAARA